ncbi:bacterial alpha-L-rhamnosidase-domain-containing protein [Aspergillus nidulans var. acristatus]
MADRLSLESPTFEHHPTGFGVGTATPRLSWRFLTAEGCPRNWKQTAYEIQITRGEEPETETHLVTSDASVLVPWPSKPLKSRECAQVRVRAFGRGVDQPEVEPTDWSSWTVVECALLNREDWAALPITDPAKAADGPLRPLRFRKSFDLSGKGTISQARLYITSLGIYRAFINGREVSDHCLAPGWTSYRYRLNYQTLDIAPFLSRDGPNTIAIEVAEGWYATRLGFLGGRRQLYGDKIAAVAQLEVRFEAETFSLVTDRTWTCQQSAILMSEYYDGEIYDACEETPGWNSSFLESGNSPWVPVQVLPFPAATLVAPDAPPVRVTEEIKPISVHKSPLGKTIVDFGQNLVGRLRVRSVNKSPGSRVTFTHAEALEHGELATRPLRIAKCTDEIICAGKELTSWSPQYTFHGFRYVQVDGWDENSDGSLLTNLTALVMHTDMRRTGWFSCSNQMVNQLHKNALWNCPQRDERLGWTGDIQIFGPSANFLYDTAGMLGEWLQDVAVEQLNEGKDGCVPPFTVPNVISEELWPPTPQAQWDDVVILGPWALYQSYGDSDILRRQYKSMLAWINRGIQRGPDGLWDSEVWQLGDWLDPTAPPVEPGDTRTNGTLVADAFLVRITSVMSQISEILGEVEHAKRFQEQLGRLKAAFQAKYIAPSGLLVGDTQTALSLAIIFELHATAEQVKVAASRLVDLVRLAQFRVATGFAGTPIITHALTKGGYPQMAYRMLLEKRCPSWMYPITMGATTMWERWDSMLPDGSINPGEMTSFNHYAFGSIINWLHSIVAGISPLVPGWKEFRVQPIPGGNIDSAEAVYETPYGRLECRWRIEIDKDVFTLELLVPPNSRAFVTLPSDTDPTGQQQQPGDSRKKRCIARQPGISCTSCSQKRWKCDLADDYRGTSGSSAFNGRLSIPLTDSRFHRRSETSIAPAEGKISVPQWGLSLPPESVCNELVDLYFDLIEEKQLLLFHRTTFIAEQRAGRVPEFLVLGMIALMARFSSNPYFEGVHPWHRARPWFKAAMKSFNSRSELINLASLQGSILLSFAALAEGDSAQEALLTSQAICMVRMLRLPENLSDDPIQREVEIRIFWVMWMMENWHAARVLIPKQLMASSAFKRPLEEEAYRNMKTTDSPGQHSETRIDALGLRSNGLWTWMLPLSTFHDQVMRLNDEIVQNTISEVDIRRRVREISHNIDCYLRDLPRHLQHTSENRERHFARGLGREFTILQLNYHHQCQMLYYQFLNKKAKLSDGGTDHEAMMYAARCKAHATALSQVMWDTNSRPGMECLWSPVNGHLLVVASSVLLYTLLFDTDDESIARAKRLLEQNFIMLLQFRKHWSLVELSMTRLKAFHRACQMNSTQENFDMDRWMIYFLNRYDASVSERYNDGVHGSLPTAPDTDIAPATNSWLEFSR